MNSNQFWLNLLNIQRNEWPVVKKLFWLQFFQGAGISFFFTAEFARFLEKFPVHELPWVMVLSALLLWITGLLYTLLEHHIPFKKFNEGIIWFMAGTMLIVRIGSTVVTDNWLYYASLAWFYVLYLLNNLEFWGIASRLFNIRQSKRLFGVVSAGDIPAKFIGYTLALLFVPFTGTLNLLFLGVVSMLFSIPFYRSIVASDKIHFEDGHENHGVHHAPNPIKHLYKTFITSTIIRRIALISLLASACIIIVNYGFYAKIKESYHNDVELAKFIAFFMAALRIAALITKTIFTSRLTTNLGVRSSLFITPFVVLGLAAIIIVAGFFNEDERFIFYIFGASSIAVDVMRTAINSPVLLTIMQPMPVHERMRAHNIIKGIMDPIATLFSGIVLIILFQIQGEINLLTLCYLLIVLALAWLAGIVYVNRSYVSMLISTISSRFFSQEEFTLNDPATLAKLKEKITGGSDQEVISILSMVATKQNPVSIELLTMFLAHPSDAVKAEAIQLVSNNNIKVLEADLKQLAETAQAVNVKQQAIMATCKLADNLAAITPYLTTPNSMQRFAAMGGMLCNSNRSIRFSAEEFVTGLMRSSNIEDKNAALTILEMAAAEYDHPLFATYLDNESDPLFKNRALSIIGKAASDETIKSILRIFPNNEKRAKTALLNAGEQAVKHIELYLKQHQSSIANTAQLINLIGIIGGNTAKKTLEQLLTEPHINLPATIKALYRSRFMATDESRQKLEAAGRAYIEFAVELIFMQRRLQKPAIHTQLLNSALQLELLEIRELLLCIFGCIYNRSTIQKARNALVANKKDTIANAMETIEVTVKKELSKYFTILYDENGIEERCNALRALYQQTTLNSEPAILQAILTEERFNYHDWTTACCLYISKKYSTPVDRKYAEKFLNRATPLLRETVMYALA